MCKHKGKYDSLNIGQRVHERDTPGEHMCQLFKNLNIRGKITARTRVSTDGRKHRRIGGWTNGPTVQNLIAPSQIIGAGTTLKTASNQETLKSD